MMSRPQSLVATSIYVFGGSTGCFWCRDFSTLSRQQLELHQLHLSKPVIASRRFSCRDLHPLSRHQPLSRHHDAVVTSRCCRDIIPLVSAQSSATYLVIPIATCIKFPSIFLMSRPHNWTVHTQNCNINQPVASISALPFELHFYSTYCCIFLLLFLLSFSLPANNKLVTFFIFLHINYSFLDENQTEKWIKNR